MFNLKAVTLTMELSIVASSKLAYQALDKICEKLFCFKYKNEIAEENLWPKTN